jgi:hypothetical protein
MQVPLDAHVALDPLAVVTEDTEFAVDRVGWGGDLGSDADLGELLSGRSSPIPPSTLRLAWTT